ncbi:MAG: hypothetical protein ACRCSV_05890 [Chlamydiales bacterium]
MADLFNLILLFIPIFLIITLSASIENNESKLLLQSTQPVVLIKKFFPARKKGLTGSFGTIFGNNPYFCNSFAFAQLDYLPPLPMQCDLFSPILSFRYLISDKKDQGFSIGGGTRYYSAPLCSVLGFNVFYDFKSMPCNHFYQIGFGFECLRFLNCISLLELRANVYLPLNKRYLVQGKYRYYPEEFIAIGTNTFYNSGGWEIELGKRIFYKKFFDLYFSISPYCLFSQEYGIEYNGLFRWKSSAYAGIQLYQNFSCRITEIAGIIGINIPLDRETACEKNIPLRIPISRWETIKCRSSIHWQTNY